MNTVLNEIKSIPGIVGGFFFDATQGVQFSDLPPIFKDENLNKIGKVLDKMYGMSQSGLTNISDLFLYYEESTIIIRQIGKTSYLVVISDPQLNQNLLIMTMNMNEDELKAMGKKFDEANEKNIMLSPAVEAVEPPVETVSAEDIIKNSPVSDQLQNMETALFKIVGPMAKIIFREAVQEWLQSQDPSESSIPMLLDILSKEINDPEKEQQYADLISP